MRIVFVLEVGTTTTGEVVDRWSCTKCEQRGVWLKLIADADRNGALHQRSVHPAQAVA